MAEDQNAHDVQIQRLSLRQDKNNIRLIILFFVELKQKQERMFVVFTNSKHSRPESGIETMGEMTESD